MFIDVIRAEVDKGIDLDRMHDVIGLERRKYVTLGITSWPHYHYH